MRYAIAFCLLGSLVAAEPVTPAPIQLANDRSYADKLQAVLAARPDGKDPDILFRWIWNYQSACMDSRAYADAEIAARALVAMTPQYGLVHSNLSVALGKQGKYQEALQEAEVAKLLSPADSMHADGVACSWLYYLGRRQEAIDRFLRIPLPTDNEKLRSYWGLRSCFFASVGTTEEVKHAIAHALQAAPDQRGFFERDMVFDRYRAEPWFIELVGVTLK